MINMHQKRGFSLIEIIVAVSILVILAGIAIPAISTQVERAKVGKLVALVDTLGKACAQYNVDTSGYATEYSGSTYTASNYHTLSLIQTTNGWEGPYIDHPITTADNPFNGNIYLYNNLSGALDSGFDINGSGANTHEGSGNYVRFYGLPEDAAIRLDAAFDKDIPGDWMETGRVKYGGGVVYVYITGGI
ncbi:MAG: prepilin-type N-terminal cleavage/methylation domain-containing protein [Planctomycetota bacterium]